MMRGATHSRQSRAISQCANCANSIIYQLFHPIRIPFAKVIIIKFFRLARMF